MNPFFFPCITPYYGVQYMPVFYQPNVFYAYPHSQLPYNRPNEVKVEQKPVDCLQDQQNNQNKPLTIQKQQFLPVQRHFDQTLKKKSSQHYTPNSETKKKSTKSSRKEENDLTKKNRDYFKNFESNVVNKIFSFLWTKEKSTAVVQKLLKDKRKVEVYYELMKIIKKFSKRYITKEYLANLCDFQECHIAYKIVAKKKDLLMHVSFEELSRAIRILINYYLKNEVVISVLTSKKMRPSYWEAHINRARNLENVIFEKISVEDYNQRCIAMYEKMQIAQVDEDSQSE